MEYSSVLGMNFGRLFVVSYAGTKKRLGHMYNCICDCGNHVVVRGSSLLNGNTRSCGCLQKEAHQKVGREMARRNKANPDYKGHLIHGGCYTKLYNHWRAMKQRCNYEGGPHWHCYGGRGIKVCEEWNNSFKAFSDWALANGYQEGLTLDRIDNNKGYEPSNCRWATPKQQGRNTRKTLFFTIDGVKKSFSDWCEEYRLPSSAVYARLQRGWDIEDALEIPLRKTKRSKDYGK